MYHRNVVRIFVCVLVTLTKEEVPTNLFFVFRAVWGRSSLCLNVSTVIKRT